MGVFFLALVFWCVLYGGTLYLIVRRTHPFSSGMALPLGLGFMVGGFVFAMVVLYRYNRTRLLRCPYCDEPVHEIDGGDPDPICPRCGKSVITSD
jgi:hypothetical protein